jgi:SAM-dependent methyltransferase
MSLKRRLKALLRPKESEDAVMSRMHEDWNQRAKENARYYVATARHDWNDRDFFDSGNVWLQDVIAPDLDLICSQRPAAEMRILEIGCGAGRMTRIFSETFGAVDSVDISEVMIAQAQAALKDRANVRFHVNDGKTLAGFGDAEFDFAFSALVFQHIPPRSIVRSYICETSRVLRPGSVFKFQLQGAAIEAR